MKNPFKNILFFLLLIQVSSLALETKNFQGVIPPYIQKEKGWELIKDEADLLLLNRFVGDALPREIFGAAVDTSNFALLATILLEIDSYSEWVNYLDESKILEQYGEDSMLVYQRYGLPWPMDDRDILVMVNIQRDFNNGIMQAHMRAVKDSRYPAKENVVRINLMEGQVGLRSLKNGNSQGEYRELVDLGGSIPEWLKGKFAKEIPLYVLKKMKKATLNEKYIRKTLTSKLYQQLLEAGLISPLQLPSQ